MLRQIAFGFLFISLIFKTVALGKIYSPTATLEEKKKHYERYNIPSYIFIALGVGILLYQKYLA